MVNFKTIKGKLKDWVCKKVSERYFKLSNERHHNLTPFTNGYDYTVNPHFEGCNMSVCNPIEVVYFALQEVYRRYEMLSVQSIVMDYSDEETIRVRISTPYPGLIIGFRGKDIDRFNDVLTHYFGRKTKVQLIELKKLYFTISGY